MTIDNVISRLKDGNDRFVEDKLDGQLQDSSRRDALTSGQEPFAIVLSCADSRVVPELAFDTGLGEIFVVRVAGNIANSSSIASIEYAVAHLGTEGATGHFVEFAGTVFNNFSMEERMTVCNMSIEMGARGGLVGIDQTTIDYVQTRVDDLTEERIENWKALNTSPNASFDKNIELDGTQITPMITTGTSPDTGIDITKNVNSSSRNSSKGLDYMQISQDEVLLGKAVDYVFIGSCTNGRIEDFRAFCSIVEGRQKADNVTAWLVPGSHKVVDQIKAEGLDKIITDAGFVLREPGCSACLAMNDDKIPAGKLSVSTSNRNFEGRQGPGSRTLLASPLVAAASAVQGVVTDPRTLLVG